MMQQWRDMLMLGTGRTLNAIAPYGAGKCGWRSQNNKQTSERQRLLILKPKRAYFKPSKYEPPHVTTTLSLPKKSRA
jgi:hypothetical protein